MKKKVLIVDDTKNIRNLLTTCLEIEDYEVLTAKDGREALFLLQNESFDLIFLDIKLPELSGTEILKRMRESNIDTPVVIMTAFATVKNAVECTKLGAVSYLQKPFTAGKIRNTLSEIAGDLNKESHSLDFHLASARKLIASHKPDEALDHIKQAFAVEPGCGEIYYLLARVYQAKGNDKAAGRFDMIFKLFQKQNHDQWR